MNRLWDVIVCGGGASGCLAAIFAAKQKKKVLLLEKNEKIGKKIYITGKGRCNFTNAKPAVEQLQYVRRNPKFLYSAYSFFTERDIIRLIEAQGIVTKIERGDRVFPESDRSVDIMTALEKAMAKENVILKKNREVKAIWKDENFWVQDQEEAFQSKTVVLATGGLSYPTTGSTGDGYRFAKTFSHTVEQTEPALVGINVANHPASVAGVSLRNVSLNIPVRKKKKEYFGEMLITHHGISGPIVLQCTSELSESELPKEIFLDFKPALTTDVLDLRIQREIAEHPNSSMQNIIRKLLPKSMIDWFFTNLPISKEKVAHQLSSVERGLLVKHLKEFPLETIGYRGFSEAVVTRGGVCVKEVNPKTMESKIIPGLFFCGEILDLHADTGGYNLQIAWSTGALAGHHASKHTSEEIK